MVLRGCAFLVVIATAWAQQTTATFYGIVKDSTGAVIPAASVTLTHEATSAVFRKLSDAAGEFQFDFLHVGGYALRIEAPGFKHFASSGIELLAGQQVRQTFTLEVGAVTETVRVEGAAPLVNTVSTEQLQTFTSTTVKELPLSRRNVGSMLRIGTGVTYTGEGVRMDGTGKNGSAYTVDGTEASGNPEGRYSSTYSQSNYIDIVSIEAIQEVHTIKGVPPAEYGGMLGGQVNVLTRSGTNDWHGSFFENTQKEALNARNQFLSSKPELTFNQFGGSAGGPIRRDRAFIFGVYEGYRETSFNVIQGTVPTQKLRDEMLRAVPSYQLALVRLPLPNRPLTSPSADTGLYLNSGTSEHRDNHVDIKGDIRLTQAGQLSLTYSRGRPFYLLPAIAPNGSNDRTWNNWQERGTATFITGSASWTSETRFGFNLTDQTREDRFLNVIDPNNSKEEVPFGRRIPGLVTTLGFSAARPELWLMEGPTWSLGQNVSKHFGKHSFKFGGRYTHHCCMRIKHAGPEFRYTSKDDLLNNVVSQVDVTFGPAPFRARMYDMGFFSQDDWRLKSNLVLNLGLRYDFFSNMVAHGKDGQDAAFYNPDGLLDSQFHVGPFRDPNNPYENDGWVNLGPRFGFSYNPDGKSKTVIRGGFGVLFSSQIVGAMWQSVGSKIVPFRSRFSKQDAQDFGIRWPLYVDDFRKIVSTQLQSSGRTEVFSIFNPHLQNPYSMHFTLGIQRELTSNMMLETAFVGNRGVKFLMSRIPNQPDRLTGIRPNPLLNVNYYIDDSENTIYTSWQTSLRKRYSRNLTGSIHYTWGKGLSTDGGDIGAYYQGDNGDVRIQEFFNPKTSRGPSAGDTTHYFVWEWVYDLPRLTGFSNTFTRIALGGWQMSGIFTANTGTPLLIFQTSGIENSRPDYIGGDPILSDYRSTLQYLNKAAFMRVPLSPASNATIRPGNIGAGAVRAPGAWNLDFALAKNFAFGDRARLQFRADMFNAMNHTNLGGVVAEITNPRFGELTSASARVIQLNMRFSW